jgi:uncharacterized protein YqjF (DUF2071 family)
MSLKDQTSSDGCFRFLKHPFPMKALFRNYFLVNFAVAPDVLQALLPPPLTPALHNGSAFLAVVIADMDRMRPAFLPHFLGVNYRQVAYRAIVECEGERGVYFLRSDAGSDLMCRLGNLMSDFRFHFADISHQKNETVFRYDLTSYSEDPADIHALFDLSQSSHTLPPTSRFASLPEAQKFLVELYTAFVVHGPRVKIRTLRVERGNLDIAVVPDRTQVYEFMQCSAAFPEGSATVDSIFYIGTLPYYWHRLKSFQASGAHRKKRTFTL